MNTGLLNKVRCCGVMILALTVLPAVYAADTAPAGAGPTKPGNFKKGLALFKSGCQEAEKRNFPEAEKRFREALEVCPLLPGAHVELGKIRMARKDPAGALEEYLKAKEAFRLFHVWKTTCTTAGRGPRVDQGIPDAYNIYFRHITLGGKGEYATLRMGTEAQRSNFVGQEGFAKDTTSVFTKNQSEARLGWQAFFEQYPTKGDITYEQSTLNVTVPENEVEVPALFYLYLGGAYLLLDRPVDAERELWVGLFKDPSMPGLHVNLSVACFRQGKYPEALNSARAARRLGFRLSPDYVRDLEARSGGKVGDPGEAPSPGSQERQAGR
ncbi:MAG: tetratricopeptide repeat protein [Acidobacteria bacterium]|nr:tetratricopeptide repeat protein [Acidobacteriota bacterium]